MRLDRRESFASVRSGSRKAFADTDGGEVRAG